MKRRVKVLRMRRSSSVPGYGRGWATWDYREDGPLFDGVFTAHPTHAAALAHAIEQVGLTPSNPEPTEAP